MPKGRPVKEFHEYLTESKARQAKVSLDEYIEAPAVAFLRYCVQAHYSVLYCDRHFPASKTAAGRLEHISSGLLPAIMGHFETYQKYLFSGIFENTEHIPSFDVPAFFGQLNNIRNVKIDPIRLAAYRGIPASSGIILADSLPGWHNPHTVNAYFLALLNTGLFDDDDAERVHVLWQLRHSIVHTGGTITVPDAQKHAELRDHAGDAIVFEKRFIGEVARKLHGIVFNATDAVRKSFGAQALQDLPREAGDRIQALFTVKSQISAWLPDQ